MDVTNNSETQLKAAADLAAEAARAEENMAAIAKAVSSGKCILFLGAAVHRPPPEDSGYAPLDIELPWSVETLCKTLADKTNFSIRFPDEAISDLKRVAQDYETRQERSELIKAVKAAVYTNKKPSPVLKMLAELDFPLVITTNYDQVFEEALRSKGKDPFVSVYKKNEDRNEETDDYPFNEDPTAARPFVFKIHGDIVRGPESIVITDEDYIQFVLRMSDKKPYDPVPDTIRYHFSRWPTLFIGYSLKDFNLRLLFKTLRWKVDKAGFPKAYSVDLRPDPLIFDVWYQQRRYVNFLAQNVWTFVPELHRRVKSSSDPDDEKKTKDIAS